MRTPPDALIATLVAPLAGTDGRIKYVSVERAEAQGLVAASRLPHTLKILSKAHCATPRGPCRARFRDPRCMGTDRLQPGRAALTPPVEIADIPARSARRPTVRVKG
jgi:hypothetical protein